MSTSVAHFRHSGRIGPVGLVVTPVVAFLAAVVVGALYGLGTFLSPFVYLNVIGTFFAPFAIGGLTGLVARLGHVRMPAFAASCALVAAFFAVWANWIGWVGAASGGQVIAWFPPGLLVMLGEMAEEGVWTIFGWTPKGVMLLGIWAIEALAFFVIAPLVAAGMVSDRTYCEACRRWLGKGRVISSRQAPSDADSLRTRLAAGDAAALADLPHAADGADERVDVVEIRCDGCSGLHLLTVRHVRLKEPDKKGKREEDSSDLIDRLHVDPAMLERLAHAPSPAAAQAAPPSA